MKIRRKSWHFRMYRFLYSLWAIDLGPVCRGVRTTHEPRDLCHYFWMTVLLVVTLPLWGAIVIVGFFYGLISLSRAWWRAGPARLLPEKPDKEEKEKRPNLLTAYIKARKEKVCPLIEVVDE